MEVNSALQERGPPGGDAPCIVFALATGNGPADSVIPARASRSGRRFVKAREQQHRAENTAKDREDDEQSDVRSSERRLGRAGAKCSTRVWQSDEPDAGPEV